MQKDQILDFLRGIFPYAIAAFFPLAGLIFAVVKLVERDRLEAARLTAATVLGICVYALLFA
ncbi:MAG TPA: hypothetical protein VHZ31_08330 [Solirubrobacteraceae bacterium]|nr:hypothetical protein [Solirubrobacteraceae bacterium]